ALLVAAPVLAVTLVVGFLVAMFQALTSIRDMTMGLVVKLASVAITLLIAGGWMMQVAVGFAKEIFSHIESAGH
ncbi:MAG: flagellar biosynthetic protein FliQ, partial [Planctomycetota bacterium]